MSDYFKKGVVRSLKTTGDKRDNFSPKVKEQVAKRAGYHCSKPDCRCLTIGPSSSDPTMSINTGSAAHITAASPGGPRYDLSLTPEERSSIENAIWLCETCATMIDKNSGIDFPPEVLRKWKPIHEEWVRSSQNKSISSSITVIDGLHYAKGEGNVKAIHIEEPTLFKPGTKSVAEGKGNITATHIGPYKKSGG